MIGSTSYKQETGSLVDLFLPQYVRDPYTYYDSLRQQHPIYWDQAMQSWIVLGYEEITHLSRDARLSQDRVTPFYQRLSKEKQEALEPLMKVLSDMMLFNDPPRHTRLRNVVRRAFSLDAISAQQSSIQQKVKELFARVLPHNRMEVIQDIAQPLTRDVIADLVGISQEARHLLNNWSSLLDEFFMQSQREVERIRQLKSSLEQTTGLRRAQPDNDLLSTMIKAQQEGFAISDDEIIATCLLLIDAGQVTTTHFIANAIRALARNPEQVQLLREKPEYLPKAISELMRYDSSVQFMTRIATADIPLGSHHIQQGQSVTLVVGAGNHDPHTFQHPDELNVTRAAHHQLSFGHGIHYCLGAPLALRESEIVLRTLLQCTQWFGLAEDEDEWHETINFRFLQRLHIIFDPIEE